MSLDEIIRTLDINVGFQLQTELSELWKGVLEKYSYVNTPDSNKEFKEMESEITLVDETVWKVLCSKVEALPGVDVETSDDYITISRQDCKTDLGFAFELNHAEPDDEIDFSELDGMSRDEAIDYLLHSENFDFDYLYISAGGRILNISPDSEDFDVMLQEIVDALEHESNLILKAIDESEKAISASREAEKEKDESFDKTYQQLLDSVKVELKKHGWKGDFRVFTSGNYNVLWCLGLKISPMSECFFSGTPEDVLANVDGLCDFAMTQLKQQANFKFKFRQNRYLKDEKWERCD